MSRLSVFKSFSDAQDPATTMKSIRVIVSWVLFGCVLVNGQNDGRYVSNVVRTTRQPYRVPVQNRGSNDGRYNSGNDGRYVPSDDGRYVHVSGKDGPGGSGGGKYTGSASPGGKYTGNNQKSAGVASRLVDGGAGRGSSISPKPVQAAAPKDGWQIIRNEKTETVDGYHYLYETENGILAEESGNIEKLTADDGLRSQGFYEYTGDDGLKYRVDYVADDNGFIPQGDHIPKIPPLIVKMLQYLADHPQN